MRRTLFAAACLLLLPALAAAQPVSLIANLTGATQVPGPGDADGQGFATVIIDGASVTYSIVVSGVPNITAAHIHQGAAGVSGGVVVDFAPTFVNGSATGVVTTSAATASAIVANPAGYYVNVHSQEFPNGAVRGQLGAGASETTTLYFGVASAKSGAAGTRYLTDARMINRSGGAAGVTLDFFPQGEAGNTAPAKSVSLTIDPNEMAVLDDFVTDEFAYTNQNGAVRITSDRQITAFARIYNDKTDVVPSGGTLGQYVVGLPISVAYAAGHLPFLSNESAASGSGFRTNLGWFNPSASQLELKLWAWDAATGAQLATKTRTVKGYAQELYNVGASQLFGAAFADIGDFYVTYAVTGGHPLFVYASRVDNVNGDAIYIPAAE